MKIGNSLFKRDRIILFIIFLCSCFLYYIASVDVEATVVNSDYSYYAIAGNDIMNGNILLKGWYGSTGSYYLLCLIYGIFGKILGFNRNLLYVVPAFIWGVMVTGVSYATLRLAEERYFGNWSAVLDNRWFSDNKRKYIALLISLLCCYSLCSLNQSRRIFCGIHLDTCMLSFVYLWIISGEDRTRTNESQSLTKISCKLVLASLCLILAIASDPLVIYFVVIPIVITFLFKLIFSDKQHEKVLYFSYMVITIFNCIIAKILVKLVVVADGIVVPWSALSDKGIPYMPAGVNFIAADNFFDKIEFGMEELLYLFNADIFGKPISIEQLFIFIHLTFIVLLGLTFMFCFKKVIKRNIFNQVLTVMVIDVICVMVFTTYLSSDIEYMSRVCYLWIAIILLISQVDYTEIICKISRKECTIIFGAFMLAVLIANASLIKKAPASEENRYQKVIAVLQERGLTQGYGNFGVSNTVTLTSGCEINVNPVYNYKGDLTKQRWLSFDTKRWDYANFVLIEDNNAEKVTRDCVMEAIGQPDEEEYLDGITIMVWNKNIMPFIDDSGASEDIDYWWSIYPENEKKVIEVTNKHFSSEFEANEEGYFISTTAGCLSYGPYKQLKKGKYNVTFEFEYTGDRAKGEVIGYVDAFSLNGNADYKKEDIIVGEGRVLLNGVVVHENCEDMEFRSYVDVPGVTVRRIVIERM